MKTTEETLARLGIKDKPMITVYNKADKADMAFPMLDGDAAITISARDRKSQDALLELIESRLFADRKKVTLAIPFADSAVTANILDEHELLAQEFNESGSLITVKLSSEEIARYRQYIQ
nr:hypothetical protein [Serratia marcescens]